MQSNRYILFDFDGTLADTYPVVLEILNELAPEYGMKELQVAEYQKLRHMHMFEAVRYLDVPWYKLPFLLNRVRSELYTKLDMVSLFPGIQEVLPRLKETGYEMGIVTANTKKNVDYFLYLHQLTDFFHFTRPTSFIFGKTYSMKDVCRSYNLNPEQTWYIGDEVRDVEAAKDCGMRNIAVSWGVNDRSLLEEAKPDVLIDEPMEILGQFL